MTFLNSLVLFGLIAATIPVIIHLLNLRKLKVVEFSTIRFLKELQRNRIRKIKIKQILLLILRTLIIIFLVLSFSRPTIKDITFAGLGSEVKKTIVIIIDNSPSMSIQDKRGEYFSQARKIVQQILQFSEEGDEIYLLPYSELNPLKDTFEPLSKNLALKNVEAIEISDISKNFYDVLLTTAKILEISRNLIKEIYIISDFHKSNLALKKFEESALKLDKIFDRNTKVLFFEVGEKQTFNISIDSISFVNRIFEINRQIGLSAIITNHSNENARNINSTMFFNDRNVSQKGLDISAERKSEFTFYGQIKNYGFVLGKSQLEDDDLVKDNTRYFNFYVPEKIRVLLVRENPQDLLFIKLVLQQTLDDHSEPIFSITETTPQFFSSYKLDNFQFIVLSSPEKISDHTYLKRYIEEGGCVLSLPGPSSNTIGFNRFTESVAGLTMAGVFGSKESKYNWTRIKEIDFNHPIIEGIFLDTKSKNIESPKIYYSFNYKSSIDAISIISNENNFDLLINKKIGNGDFFLLTSALSLDWTEFPIKPFFVPLINRIALYAGSKNLNNHYTYAGENLSIPIKTGNLENLKLIYPDGREKVLEQIRSGGSNIVSTDILALAGNYKITTDNEIIGVISVNINPDESITKKLDKNELQGLLEKISPNAKTKIFSASDETSQILREERYGTELWKLFLILAILLIVIEMIIARSSKKDLEEINKI